VSRRTASLRRFRKRADVYGERVLAVVPTELCVGEIPLDLFDQSRGAWLCR
jgi:hypothetical protein